MRISDWSSDVCSSDLRAGALARCIRDGLGVIDIQQILAPELQAPRLAGAGEPDAGVKRRHAVLPLFREEVGPGVEIGHVAHVGVEQRARSEEHTSELQSLMRISYAVFCLKKKKQK